MLRPAPSPSPFPFLAAFGSGGSGVVRSFGIQHAMSITEIAILWPKQKGQPGGGRRAAVGA